MYSRHCGSPTQTACSPVLSVSTTCSPSSTFFSKLPCTRQYLTFTVPYIAYANTRTHRPKTAIPSVSQTGSQVAPGSQTDNKPVSMRPGQLPRKKVPGAEDVITKGIGKPYYLDTTVVSVILSQCIRTPTIHLRRWENICCQLVWGSGDGIMHTIRHCCRQNMQHKCLMLTSVCVCLCCCRLAQDLTKRFSLSLNLLTRLPGAVFMCGGNFSNPSTVLQFLKMFPVYVHDDSLEKEPHAGKPQRLAVACIMPSDPACLATTQPMLDVNGRRLQLCSAPFAPNYYIGSPKFMSWTQASQLGTTGGPYAWLARSQLPPAVRFGRSGYDSSCGSTMQ